MNPWTQITRLSLAFDFDSYVGNFLSEFFCHLTGYHDTADDPRPRVRRYLAKPAPFSKMAFDSLFETRVHDHGDDQIERAYGQPCPTPGWWNDGMGQVYEYTQKTPAQHNPVVVPAPEYPCYHSIAVHLRREPTEEEIQLLVERAKSFPSVYEDRSTLASRLIRLIGVRAVAEQHQTAWQTISLEG